MNFRRHTRLLVFATVIAVLVILRPTTGQEAPSHGPDKFTSISELILAVRQQDHARIESLIAKGTDPTVTSGPGQSAWIWAVLLQDNISLKMLLKNTKVLDQAPSVEFGFMVAVTTGNLEAVRMLIERRLPVDIVPYDGATPLLVAAGNGATALIRLLLERGADVNRADLHGDTPLMAAVRAGPPDAVRALMAGGAKPETQDQQGRSAVRWATRYARRDLVEILGSDDPAAKDPPADPTRGHAGLTIRAAATRSLPLLQRSAAIWTERAKCVSCHHQNLMTRTVAVALRQGFTVDEGLVRAQDSAIKDERVKLLRQVKPALTDEASMLRATAGAGRPVFEIAYDLAAAAEGGVSPDDTTEPLASFLSKAQSTDGHWLVGRPRIPLKSSDFTTTACAIRALQAYAPSSEARATAERVTRAAVWLEKMKPISTEDKAFRLRGLRWAKADQKLIEASVKLLKQEQNRDGGWGQMPEFNSDAYATGEVLVALRECGDIAASDTAFQRGIRYLLQTQEPDGSWFVHKRAVPFQGYLETGFPHGKFQIPSFSGTCWATMALMLAEPPPAHTSKP